MTSVLVPVAAARPVTPLGILAAELGELTQELDSLGDIAPGLRARLRRACELADGLDPYLGRCTTPESPALRELARRTCAEDWSHYASETGVEQEMLSGHVEGQTLKFLVHLTRARRVLEIGMFTGYSALAMAEALPHDGQVVACELDPDVADFARRCFAESSDGHKIIVKVAPAMDTLDALCAARDSFDLVFIDADKAGYLGYFEALLSGDLIARHGLICVDNTLMQGQPWSSGASTPNGTAIAAFNAAVVNDPRVEQVLLPLRDGLTLIRRVDTAPAAAVTDV